MPSCKRPPVTCDEPWSKNSSKLAVVAKYELSALRSFELNIAMEIVCGCPLLSRPANGVRFTRYGLKSYVSTLGMGNHKNGSMPPVKIQGNTGATPAGIPSMVTSPSRKAVPPQLPVAEPKSSGKHDHQNSSPICDCRKTSRYACSILRGSETVIVFACA